METTSAVQAPAAPEEPMPPWSIHASLVAKLNLADFQNSVPMLRDLTVTNGSASTSGPLRLRLTSTPAFVKPRTWNIDAIEPGQRLVVNDLDVRLDGSLLSRLTEADTATVSLFLDADGDVEADGNVNADGDANAKSTSSPDALATFVARVELLPRNQWGGLSHLPDMVAAFVQPNDPVVDRLLKQAADVLRRAGRDSSLDGYAGGARRAWELTSAVWSAVVALGLDYALPPASFEHTGQKVRAPAQVLDSRLATCLDLTLLFAAALEQCGLNPLVVFTKGHAFAGVWLKSEEFSTTVVDDVTALRKRVKLKEMLLFETTLATKRPAVVFPHATDHAARQIDEAHAEAFELAVDIRRARLQRIKPLASNDVSTPVGEPEDEGVVEPPFMDPPDLPEAPAAEAPESLDPKDRLARWQRKLLDLSLRNNLLNFRGSKKSLRLEAPDPGALEDLLSDGATIKLLPRPDLMDGADPRSQALHEAREREDLRRAHAIDALQRKEVFVAVDAQDLESRLVDLYRTARTTLQEGGANTLFLALGFLTWAREDKSQPCRAPLILVPVTLNRKSARSGFTLSLHDDEPRFNPTLIEMMRQDFRLNLGIADGELPRDEHGLDVAAIWRTVSHAVKDIKGWEVSEEVTLAMFSFAKYLMWKDLTERTDQLRENPVVRHLIDTPRDAFPSGVAFPDPRRLDRDFAPQQMFCPLAADSSQLSAVMASARGKDFVLIGPPGTGKSQTIANVVAQCLAEGKRVLFVSEKIAALDVVYRRLREVGLGEFCLELHSSKARKLDVLAQLQKSWEAQGEIDADDWRLQADKLKRQRDALNVYVERLHVRHRNGLTIHQAIGRVVDGDGFAAVTLSWPRADAHSVEDLEALRESVERLVVNADAVGVTSVAHGPLAGVACAEWTPTWQQALVDAARAVRPIAAALASSTTAFADAIGVAMPPLSRDVRGALGVLARALPAAAGHDWRFVLAPDASATLERLHRGAGWIGRHRTLGEALSPAWSAEAVAACRKGMQWLERRGRLHDDLALPWPADAMAELVRGLELIERLQEATRGLSAKYTEQVEQLNLHQLHRAWKKAGETLWPMSWLAKRRIRQALGAVVAGADAPDVERDLAAWVAIRDLRTEIAAVDSGAGTEGVWTGLRTRPEFVRAALAFQKALSAARARQPWKDDEMDAVASGRCGESLAKALARLRELRSVDDDIAGLAALGASTQGLWAGQDTNRERLEAALAFVSAVDSVRRAGALAGVHDLVASGECGSVLAQDHLRLRERSAVEVDLASLDDLVSSTGATWRGLSTSLDDVERATRFHASMSAALPHLAATPEQHAALVASLAGWLGDGSAVLAAGGTVATAGERYLAACASWQPAIDHLAAVGAFTPAAKAAFGDLPVDDVSARCEAIVAAEPRLHAWCAWRKARDQAASLGLMPLVEAIESGGILPADLRRAFEVAYAHWWLRVVVDDEPVIRTFVSAEHERRIGDFRALDRQFVDLTRRWVRATLCAGLPKAEDVSRNSEWGVLRHELSKKKRHLPLRELMTRIPTALTTLAPCLLMSPLSIAQYLAADTNAFDLVVFDEASQIPVWDAIGAIARGRQVVMVGDPKQLPPTSFFDRAESSVDDEDVEADLESILDECMGANLPTMNLAWHYRSRHESLIAFSNHHYYGGGLVTFPSPVTDDRAVSFHFVDGVYEKGGARINKPEARALVADIVARLRSPGFRESGLTIGVVTFNGEQMTLIEDLLDEERRQDPSLEPYFDEMQLEPLFVKNLESVQGDERDIMYFSITYGPDATRAVSMNFGPMNRDGGERRLNVAITRARHELRVFSSLKAEQLDLARTQAAGVRDLKHFLEFAERGPRALAESNRGSLGGFESPFEEAVAAALATRGWLLHTQIGASSFRVDLAVVHPDAPGVYLTGIECDGATYHRSATARDRDLLREQVLRGLGWEIVRVWSTDWWIDRAGTLDRLDARLKEMLASDRQTRAQRAEAETARRAAEAAILAARGGRPAQTQPPATPSVEGPASSGDDTDGVAGSLVAGGVYARNAAAPSAPRGAGAAAESSPASDVPGVFVEADPLSAVPDADAARFFDSSYDTTLALMIRHVVQVEGPILDAVLARRIARAHGWQRTGGRIQERVCDIAQRQHSETREDVGVFFWFGPSGPGAVLQWRRAADDAGRPVDEICMEELCALARCFRQRGHRDEVLLVAMARELGLAKLRTASRVRLERAVALLDA
jgi:very-short-patch-repair endonuclease